MPERAEFHNRLVTIGKKIVLASPQEIIDLDVEADGIAGMGSVLSVGAISPRGETFYRELKPASDRFIPSNREFCEAHGLQRERLLVEGMDPDQAWDELDDWVVAVTNLHHKNSPVLAAFNASYDFPLVDLALHETNIPNRFGVAGFCIKSMAMALGPTYDWKMTSKGRLPAELVPEGDFTHNALEDSVYQQKIHFAMVGKLAVLRGEATL